jgi:hypothetical protein
MFMYAADMKKKTLPSWAHAYCSGGILDYDAGVYPAYPGMGEYLFLNDELDAIVYSPRNPRHRERPQQVTSEYVTTPQGIYIELSLGVVVSKDTYRLAARSTPSYTFLENTLVDYIIDTYPPVQGTVLDMYEFMARAGEMRELGA